MKISLRVSLLSTILTLMLFSLSAVIFYSYQNSLSIVKAEIQTRLQDVLSLAVQQIDPDKHDLILRAEDVSTDTYNKLWVQLQRIKESTSDMREIYTMRVVSEERMVYVIGDNNPEAQNAALPLTPVEFDSRQEALEYVQYFTDTNEVWTEDDFIEDQWGIWLTGYAPFYREDGSLSGVLGMDIAAKQVRQISKDYFKGFILLLLPLLIVVIFLTVIISKLLSNSIRQLALSMEQVASFEVDETTVSSSFIKEIQAMTHSMNIMKTGLSSFRKYVPYLLVRKLFKEGVEACPGGNKQPATILFSDIADFTTISEETDPAIIANYLAQYFEVMTRVIEDNHGVVDKFIGDAVMAFWNAPLPLEEHEFLACKAAVECQEQIRLLNEQWKKNQDNIQFHTRIGIASGDVIVGNIGAKNRLNYTAIGDTVNIASRLESLNKSYGTNILINNRVYMVNKARIESRYLDEVKVKGKKQSEKVYELIKIRPTPENDHSQTDR